MTHLTPEEEKWCQEAATNSMDGFRSDIVKKFQLAMLKGRLAAEVRNCSGSQPDMRIREELSAAIAELEK